VFQVMLGKRIVCQVGKIENAENLAKFFTDHNVTTLTAYRALPFSQRRSYVLATMDLEPNLPL
jgi:hypothetical protein